MNWDNFGFIRWLQGGRWVKVRGNWMTYDTYLDVCALSIEKLHIEDEEYYVENYLH